MKDYNEVYELIRKHHTVHAVPRLVAEFNHNRYSSPTPANVPAAVDSDENPDLFPIKSIVEGRRPSRGINKARVGMSFVSEDYEVNPKSVRYYTAQADDTYKYWSSPETTTGTAFPAWDGVYATRVNPEVTYKAEVKTNKIVIGFENSLSSPVDYDIFLKKGIQDNWIKAKGSVADNLVIDDEGRLILYWNGADWTQTKDIEQYTTIAGIQLRVKTMSASNSYFNLIELGARLEWDLSSYLLNVGDQFELGNPNTLNPLGVSSSNVATIDLFNHYEENEFIFSSENTNGLFYGMMEENVKFTLDYVYDTTPVGGSEVAIRQFTMHSTDHWSAGSLKQASVSVRDSSKFLQETKGQTAYFTDRTIGSLVFMLLDGIGFNQYDIGKMGKQRVNGQWVDIDIALNTTIVPFFWSSSETTIWDSLSSLAEGTQTAIYFDGYDRLQVRTRNQAFSEIIGDVWTVRGEKSQEELADISEYEIENADVSNDVTVNYQTTGFDEYVQGTRRNKVVWEPEDEVVYTKSSDIQEDLSQSAMQVKFTPGDAALWPFESMMVVEAEYIKYKGKQFVYYPAESNNYATVVASATTVWLESFEDYKKYHYENTPLENRYLNKFTGYLKITQRGAWNTPVQTHLVDTSNLWEQKNYRDTSVSTDANAYFKDPARLAKYKKAYQDEVHYAKVKAQQAQKADYNRQRAEYKNYVARLKAKDKKQNRAAKKAGRNEVYSSFISPFVYRPSPSLSNWNYKGGPALSAYNSYVELYNLYKNAAITDGIDVPAEKGTLRFITNKNYSWNHFLTAVRGSISDTGFKYYSSRVRFNSDSNMPMQHAGIMLQSQNTTNEDAYYFELKQGGTTYADAGGWAFYHKNAAGVFTILAQSVVNPDAPFIVLKDKWYTLDVDIEGNTGTSSFGIQLFIDGRQVAGFNIPSSGGHKIKHTGRCGIFTRGGTDASFEFFAAIGQGSTAPADALNSMQFGPAPTWDRVRNQFTSNRVSSDFINKQSVVENQKQTPLASVPQQYSKVIFDEFGPIAHEIRNFKVKFDADEMPVLAPYIAFTNTGNVDILQESMDAYGADIYMINTAREDAALKGTDDSHTFFIYGMPLKQKDGSVINKKNEKSIAAIGEKQLTFESTWIQNENMAVELGQWIVNHWTSATDIISVDIFGNPLIEVGDVVSMNIDKANIFADTHKYFVTSATNSFAAGGLKTRLTLRRARN